MITKFLQYQKEITSFISTDCLCITTPQNYKKKTSEIHYFKI